MLLLFQTLHSGDRQNNSQSASINDDAVLQIQSNRLREKIKKQSRTHALLVSIVVVFALSWFPLNILNIILDIHNIFAVTSIWSTTFWKMDEKLII